MILLFAPPFLALAFMGAVITIDRFFPRLGER